jgi:pantetheine-phosphate adenylyltransferase
MKKALLAGSFDPFTLGHQSLVTQSLNIFDHLTILLAVSPDKKSFFTLDERVKMLEELFKARPNINIDTCQGIVTDYALKEGINTLIRGVRNAVDLAYEQQLAEINKVLAPEVQTIFLNCESAYQHISSTYVREFLKYGKDISSLVPEAINKSIVNRGKDGN